MSRLRVCVPLVVVVFAAACSGGGSASPSATPGVKPVVVGFINQEGSPTGSFPEAGVGARAAMAYVNDVLGGVGDRALELESCKTSGTPESSQDCAQQVLGAKPVAVVSGIDLAGDASVSVITSAGVPYVTGSPTLTGELTTPGSYAFTGGTAADLLGIGAYLIETKRVTSIHVLHEDLPGLLNAAISATGDIFRAKRVTDVKLVAEKADVADFAPALTAAAAGNPQAIIVVFPAQSCARILQAAKSLGVKSPLYFPGVCASRAVVAGGGSVLDRTYFGSGFLPLGESGGGPDADAFRKGVPADQRSPVSASAFAAVLNVARLMSDGAVTPEALKATLAATKDEPGALAHPYTCDGKQLPLLQSVCNSNIRLLQHRSGAFVDVLGTWISGAKLNELVN